MATISPYTPPHTHGSSPAPVNRKNGRHRTAILACALLSLALGHAAKAAPGDLDRSFDADGLVLTHFGRIDDDSVGGRNDVAKAVAVSPDGKVVVAGYSQASGGFNLDFALARYNPDGTPDTSFGAGGRVLTGFPPSEFGSNYDEVTALVVQPDGKPVVAGVVLGFDAGFVLARYSPAGSLDASFGSNGVVITDFRSDTGDNFDSVSALVLQPDGKLVAAGSSNFFDQDLQASVSDFALARYNPDGALDTSFGSGGLVLTDVGGCGPPGSFVDDHASELVLQPDGKLVAAGRSTCGLALARYNPDGSLDGTFGSGGRVSDLGTSLFGAVPLVLQPDGKLVTLEESPLFDISPPATIFSLSRYNPDGTLDTSFGTGGRVMPSFGSDSVFPEALILQPDGKLVVAGATGSGCFSFVIPGFECSASDFVLVRHNPDGSLDTSFGSGGRVLTNFSGRFDFFTNRAQALVQQPDGKLVAAGISRASGDTDFALARYLVTDERPAPPPRCGGRRATMLGTPGNDTLRGTFFGGDVILGLGGHDTIRGLGGEDILCGGPGNDVLIGGDDTDRLYGGTGNDKLFGDRGLSVVDGDDSLYGGPGRDTLVADDGADLLFGERGNDRLFGDAGQDTIDGGEGRDRCRDRLGSNAVARCESGRVRRPPEPPRDPAPSNPSACPPQSNTPGGCTGN